MSWISGVWVLSPPEICNLWLSSRTGSFPLPSGSGFHKVFTSHSLFMPQENKSQTCLCPELLQPNSGTHGPSFPLKNKPRHLTDILRLLALSTLQFYSDHYPFLLPKYIKNNLNRTQSKENISQVKLQSGPERITGESLLFSQFREKQMLCVCV